MRPVALGLRARITAVFAAGALALSASLAFATYELTRSNLLDERERAAVRAAYLDASFVRTGLGGADPDIGPLAQRRHVALHPQWREQIRGHRKHPNSTVCRGVDIRFPMGGHRNGPPGRFSYFTN